VDQAGDRSELGAPLFQKPADRRRIADVGSGVNDLRALSAKGP
jgi:hypothetical protein